jgi:flagellar hook-associated protein 3 FlgL
MSTGTRVAVVSDDPGAVAPIFETAAASDAAKQIGQNLSRVKAEVDASEQALSSAVKIMERLRVLGAQGATSTQTAESRSAIAEEVGALLTELGGIAATQVSGRYVFSGDDDRNAPYTVDATRMGVDGNPDPIGVYRGGNNTRIVQHPNGTTFTIARTADQIFNDPAQSVFGSVRELWLALRNNDEAGIQDALTKVTSAGTVLNGHLAFYGATQNRVNSAIDYGSKLDLQYTTELSTLRDADLTGAIVELQQAETQQQAALLARSKMPRTSLFDFLG